MHRDIKITVQSKLTNVVIKLGLFIILSSLVPTASNLSIAQPLFQDDTDAVGGPFHVGETWGAAWGDLNGDLFPDLFTSNHGALNSVIRNNGDGTFKDVVEQVDAERVWTGVPASDIHGGSWADFDNDGDQDLFVTRSSVGARVHLMQNSGSGGFTEEGGEFGIGGFGGGRFPVLFDYDNDGNLDLALAGVRAGGVVLFNWNPPTNNYVIETSEAGLDGQCLSNNTGMATDLFNTGTLNYICVNETSVPERVFDTNDLPFNDVSDTVDSVGTNTDAVLADFNNDSLMDMVVNRGRIRPAGVGKISDTRIEAWFTVAGTVNFEDSMTFSANGPISIEVFARNVDNRAGLRVGSAGNILSDSPLVLDPNDSDNFGLAELRSDRAVYVGYDEVNKEWTIVLSTGENSQAEGAYIVVTGEDLSEPTTTGITGVDLPLSPQFLLNDGSRLVNQGPRGIGAIQCGGIAAADFDNDMDVDLYMACRSSISNFANRLYLNDGDGNFSLVENHGGEGIVGTGIESQTGTSGMAITADYNLDGFMDVFVTNGNRLFPILSQGNFSGGGPSQFFRNLADNGNHWIQIDLQGVESNRDGYGAKVFLTVDGVTQYREQNGQYHRWSQDSKRIHFGLGSNTSADITIEWPDGTSDSFTGVSSDQLYLAVQGDDLTPRTLGLNAPSLTISGDSVAEVESANLTVSLFPPSAETVQVNFETFNITADAATLDYTPVTGTLTFDPFQTEQIINVAVLPDVEVEPNENFGVLLSEPVNALLSQPQGLVEIRDDDAADADAPIISISDAVVREGDSAIYTISISENPTQTVIVDFETVEGTAIEGLDYEFRSGQVRFEPGGLLSVIRRVNTLQDTGLESTETFDLILSNPQNANIISAVGQTTIFDQDSVILDISIDDEVSVLEGSDATLTVTLSAASNVPVSVDFASNDIIATAGADYIAISGTLEFAPGEISQPIVLTTLPNIEDDVSEETLSIILSNASNGVLANDVGVVTIVDPDSPDPDAANNNNFGFIPPILILILEILDQP